jgi:hypothetical protein
VTLAVPDAAQRAALADVVGRVVRLDPTAVVRLRGAGDGVALWAGTPFDVLVAAAAPGRVEPADTTVVASDLLAALSVVDAPEVDPGSAVDDRWRGDLPPAGPWSAVGTIPAADVDDVVARATDAAASLDATAWEGGGVRVPARCLVAVAGMGWPADGGAVPVALSTDGSWLRLDAGPPAVGAAIVRRRRPRLAVLV